MKAEKYTLTALCILALGWVVEMLVGIVGLARYQEVPWAVASFEMAMFLGAALIPVITTWSAQSGKRTVLVAVWLPCVLYVMFLAVRVATSDLISGGVRILIWLVIAGLFIHVLRNKRESNQPLQRTATSRRL